MNKANLINEIANSTGLSKSKALEVIDVITESIQNSLIKGERVMLSGFGTWNVTNRISRKGRNPQTGKEITIPAKKVAKFKAGSALSNQINS